MGGRCGPDDTGMWTTDENLHGIGHIQKKVSLKDKDILKRKYYILQHIIIPLYVHHASQNVDAVNFSWVTWTIDWSRGGRLGCFCPETDQAVWGSKPERFRMVWRQNKCILKAPR